VIINPAPPCFLPSSTIIHLQLIHLLSEKTIPTTTTPLTI
jgi:hypothetical protein